METNADGEDDDANVVLINMMFVISGQSEHDLTTVIDARVLQRPCFLFVIFACPGGCRCVRDSVDVTSWNWA